MDCSLPGSSVYGILQSGMLEGVAISFSRGSSQPGSKPSSPALAGDSLALSHLRSPAKFTQFHIFFWPHCMGCGTLILWPRIEPRPPAVQVQSLNHGTIREFPVLNFLYQWFHFLRVFLRMWWKPQVFSLEEFIYTQNWTQFQEVHEHISWSRLKTFADGNVQWRQAE